MEFKFVDVDDISEDDLISVLDYNRRCANKVRNEISKLKEVTTVFQKGDFNSKNNFSYLLKNDENKENKRIIDVDFEGEVDYYLSDFKLLEINDLESNIDQVLPSRKNSNYKRIIMRIISEMIRDIKELNEIIVSESNMSSNDLKEYRDEILCCRKKIELLKLKISKSSNENINTLEDEDEEIENTLIFVPTLRGNIRVLDDLKNIPVDYYAGFLGLFKSIKDGSFKNIKRFTEIDVLRGAIEVKDFKIRVVFTRLSKNKYAILSAFMKKTDNDLAYRRPLEIKMQDYKNNIYKIIMEQLDNPEYLEYNKKIEEELFRILGENEDKKEESENNKEKVRGMNDKAGNNK